MDSRNSFITNSRAEISGIKLGVEFGKKLRVGGGYHWLSSSLYKDREIRSITGVMDTAEARLQLRYFAYYIEYVYYKTKRWELSIPFQLGVGDTRYTYSFEGKKYVENPRVVMIYEPSISMQYKFFRWLGAGADVGARVMFVNNKAIKQNLNSPTYAFKLLIWYDELFKMAFPNSKITKKLDSI